MVIIEVDRDFEPFRKLLGKHEWSEFLQRPKEEEAGKASKVFWCHYNSGRMVQKNGGSCPSVIGLAADHGRPLHIGWKRVDIEEHWFTNWSQVNE